MSAATDTDRSVERFVQTSLLSKADFIRRFSQKKIPWATFLKTYRVQSGKVTLPLREYMELHDIHADDLLPLYNHLLDKHEYLDRFYDISLEPLVPIHIVESPMPLSRLNNNNQVKYKNLLRNLYFNDILKNTSSGLENIKTYLQVLEDLYNRHIIDYKLLTPSARFYIKQGRIGSVFSSFYFRASIMNPYIVYSLNKRLLRGTRIFTPTLGWSSYCYGFMECDEVIEYVGNDIIPDVCKTTAKFAQSVWPQKAAQFWCQPSEDLLQNAEFMKKYRQHFDVVFFSPPYYRLEIYPGKKQSTERYLTYEEWLSGYWEKTVRLCWHVLQPGGRLCYIVSNYGTRRKYGGYYALLMNQHPESRIGGTSPPDTTRMVEDMNRITQSVGFKNSGPVRKMWNKSVAVNVTGDDNSESICVFTRPI